MSEQQLPITFEPRYGSVVTRVLPAVVLMMGVCGGFFLWAHLSSPGPWVLGMSLASFGVGAGFLVLYLYYLIYREVTFREEGIVVRRYLFPDRAAGYETVTGVSSTGFRLDGFPVTCHTMENAGELRTIVSNLQEGGYLEPAPDGEGMSAEMRRNIAATTKAGLLGALLWALLEPLGLAPPDVPDLVFGYGVITATLIIGAPTFKRLDGA